MQAAKSQGMVTLVVDFSVKVQGRVAFSALPAGVSFVRLGRTDSVHPELRDWVMGGRHHPDQSVAGMQRIAATTPVVRCAARSWPGLHSYCLFVGRQATA